MIYLIMLVILFFLHLILKLNWYMTGGLAVYFFLVLRFHVRRQKQQKMQEQRFYDAATYMDTLLYAFVKEGKIDGALQDVADSFAGGEMKSQIEQAIAHMHMTFDESEVAEDALKMIEQRYACHRLEEIHEFMLHVEYYGGDIEKPVHLLLEDKNHWERRIKNAMQERKKMFRDIVLSIIVSLAICGMVLYLPVMNVDISQNMLTQILTVVVIVLDDWILFGAQKFMAVDWLQIDWIGEDADYEKKMQNFCTYQVGKERRLSIILGILTAMITGSCLFFGKQWWAAMGMAAFLIGINQHHIGHALAKKRLIQNIRSAFPNWLMDLVLLLQSENVQVALSKSQFHVPGVLREEVRKLVDRLAVDPESSEPYHQFLSSFAIPEVYSTMSMLYSLSVGNSGSADRQVSELITKNQDMLENAEEERMKNKNSGMYLLFLAPVLTASFKLVADMAIFMLTFLSTSVI